MSVDYYMDYINKGIAVVPAKARFDEKKQLFFGKIPAVTGWTAYVKELPTRSQILGWPSIKNITGIKIVTGEASNIGCIDVDEYDPEIVERIIAIIPYTPCRIMGNIMKKGGKFLYRLYEDKSQWAPPAQLKQKVINSKEETVADIFYGNSCIVIPPSIYSMDRNGENIHYYRWYDKSLEQVGVENLPLLPLDIRYKIGQIVGGATKTEIANTIQDKSLSLNTGLSIVEGKNRHSNMGTLCSELIRKRVSLDTAITSLLEHDIRNNKNNQYFLDKTKGHQSISKEINAIKYYSDQLTFVSRGKTNNLEIPKINGDIPEVGGDIYWNPLQPLTVKGKIETDDVDDELIPSKWQRFIKDVAATNGVSKEVCFYTLLTQLSSLIGNKKTIKAKLKNKSWEEAHNIWAIYVSPSGTRKSQVVKTLSFPLEKVQSKIDDSFKDVSYRFEGDAAVRKIKLRELKKQREAEVVASISDGNSIAVKRRIEDYSSQISVIESESKQPKKPQAIVKGATTEKLIEIIGENKTGTYLEFNELSQLTSLFKKKGYETLRTFLMDSWDGLRPYSYQTKGSGEVFIEKNCSSLFACVQNSIFEKELEEISMDINDDGFYQRSFIVINDKPIGVAIDEHFDPSKYESVIEAFYKAYELEPSLDPIHSSPDAYALYMEYEQRIVDISAGASSSALSSFWSKFTGKTVKLASLIEFIECRGSCHNFISYGSMLTAIKLMERQIEHIEKIFPDRIEACCREIMRAFKFGIINNSIDHGSMVKRFKFLNRAKICDRVMVKLYDINAVNFVEESNKVKYYFNPEIKKGSY